MKFPRNAIVQVVEQLLDNDAWKATKYLSDRKIVRATRMRANGKLRSGFQNIQINLTLGNPNYQERDFIKIAKKAGEPFPIKRVQLRAVPKRRGK